MAENIEQLQIFMPSATLNWKPELAYLTVEIIVKNTNVNLPKLKQVVHDHLICIGSEELTVEWQRVEWQRAELT